MVAVNRARVLARLASGIAEGGHGDPLALRLCRACVEILGARGGAITLAPSGVDRWTVCATDAVAARLESVEEVLGDGPGHEAARTGAAVVLRVADGAALGLGEFVHQARELAGAATLYSLPMLPSPHTIGVVTVYQDDGVGLDLEADERQFLADAIGAALLRDTETIEGADSASWLERARVHQATGMVVAQLGISPADALALLRAHAFADGTTLDTLASAVVEHRDRKSVV